MLFMMDENILKLIDENTIKITAALAHIDCFFFMCYAVPFPTYPLVALVVDNTAADVLESPFRPWYCYLFRFQFL